MKRFNAKSVAGKAVLNTLLTSALLLILSGFTLTTAVSAAELIVNGGFEAPYLPSFPDGSRAHDKGWTTFYGQNYLGTCTDDPLEPECNDNMLIPGWSMVWTDTLSLNPEDPPAIPGRIEIQHNSLVDRVNPIKIALGQTPLAYAKFDEQKAELDSHDRINPDGSPNRNANVSAFQEFEVCPRTAYVLNYQWNSRTTIQDDNDVRVLANGNVVRINTLNDDWQEEVINFVTSDDINSKLAFVSFATGSNRGMSLDGVSVTGPDPTKGECPLPPAEICNGDGISNLTLLYNGNDFTEHYQSENKVSIVPATLGLQGFPVSALIEVYNHKDELQFSGEVKIGHFFTIAKLAKLLRIDIIDPDTTELIQTVEFHTSCSQPLNKFDEFGGITIWSATAD